MPRESAHHLLVALFLRFRTLYPADNNKRFATLKEIGSIINRSPEYVRQMLKQFDRNISRLSIQ